MRTNRTGGGKRTRPILVTKRHEEILQAIYFYRYMTAVDVAHLLFSPGSLTHVRSILSSLAGGADFQNNQYLYRFPLSGPSLGNSERVFTLGSRGRDFLAQEVGLPVDWYFRPDKVKHFSHGHIVHSLVLTRFLVAAKRWSSLQSDFALAQTRISYELAKLRPVVTLGEGREAEAVPVIPDAWLLFEQLKEGKHLHWLPIMLEIDRGTEYQQKFRQHVSARIEFIRSGEYKKIFGHDAVTVVYATTGDTTEYRQRRRMTMGTWTKEVLMEQKKESWASLFLFSAITFEDIYKTPLYHEPVWYQPGAAKPVSIFSP